MPKNFRNNLITKFSLKRYVSKVSFVPLNLKDEEAFVTLGKHSTEKRKDQFNFIGGGTKCPKEEWDFKNDSEKMNIISRALFEEVYEEFGIMLNWTFFNQSLIDVKRSGAFLLFYLNICNINPETWRNMQNDRFNIENLGRKYKEICDVKEYNLTFIQEEHERLKDPETNKVSFYIEGEIIEVSRYVISMNRHMIEMIEKIKDKKEDFAVDIKNFKAIPLKYIYDKSIK
jgi:hypothetical protein